MVLTAAAWVVPAKLCLALTVTLSTLLLASPSWFLHYPGLVAGPLAVTIGAGTGVLIRAARSRRRWFGVIMGVVVTSTLAYSAVSVLALRLGRPVPADQLRAAVDTQPSTGCVTADDPTALVVVNALTRNLDRGCPFVADLGGYSYQFAAERGRWLPRARDARWQQVYLHYLRSGDVTLSYRYGSLGALSPSTLATVNSWPVILRVGRYTVRMPQ